MEIMYIFFILWGVINAVVARNRGRNEWAWFGLGLLLGPFALIPLFAMSKNPKKPEKKAVKESSVKKCPFCAELIKAEAIKCRYCHEDLTPKSADNIRADLNQK